MFKIGDIVKYNKVTVSMVNSSEHFNGLETNSFLEKRYIVHSINDKDRQLSMLDLDDTSVMRLGNYSLLEVDIIYMRSKKIEKIIGKI